MTRWLLLAMALVGCASSSEPRGEAGGGGTAGASGSGGAAATNATASAAASSTVAAGGATSSTNVAAAATSGAGGSHPGGSSGGSGGPSPVGGTAQQAGGITYNLIVPSSYVPGTPTPFLLVFSGTEGADVMTSNLEQVGALTGTGGFIEAVIDGVNYNGNGAAGATVLDAVRAAYDVDDDRTYLLGESAGTTAAEALGFHLRQSYFAAYWANDVNTVDSPASNASSLGFAPWGQVGPGGETQIADQIVAGMQGAGYRLPTPAPYAGQGATTHGDPNQFIAAVSFFAGKSR